MTDPTSRLAIRSAAQRVHDDTADPAYAELVPVTLDAMQDALTTLSHSCYAAAHSFVPLGDGDESMAERFARSATSWPSPRGGAGPSYEQQIRVVSSLHDAAAALHAAAAHCARASRQIAATMEPVA